MTIKTLTLLISMVLIANELYADFSSGNLIEKITEIESSRDILPQARISKLEDARMIAEKRGLKEAELLAASFQAEILYNLGEMVKVEEVLEEYGSSASESSNFLVRAKFLQIELWLADEAGDLNTSIKIVKKLEDIMNKVSERRMIAGIYSSIGLSYSRYDNQSMALKYTYKALEIFEELKDKNGESVALNAIGNSYMILRDYESAIEKFMRALTIVKEQENELQTAIYLFNIGECYLRLGQKEKSIDYLERSYRQSQKIGDRAGMAYCRQSLGVIYEEKNKLKKSLDYLLEAHSIFESIGDFNGRMNAAIKLLSLYSKLNMSKKADLIIEKIESYQPTTARFQTKKSYYNSRYKHEKRNKQYSKALESLEKLVEVDAKIDEFQLNKTIRELKVSYETEKKVLENNILHEKNKAAAIKIKRQKEESLELKILFAVLVLILVIIGALIHLSVKKTKLLHIEKLTSQIRMRSLIDQMHPHFLFNALNVIANQIHESKDNADDSIIRLSNMYRLILQSSNRYTWKISYELELIENYLKLQKNRFEEKLSYKLNYQGIDTSKVECPCLMLHTLVENAIKHGIALNIDGGHLTVNINPVQGGYLLSVENTGSGDSTDHSGTGTGIKNTRRRLLNMYGSKSELEIQFGSEFSKVQFFITGEEISPLVKI